MSNTLSTIVIFLSLTLLQSCSVNKTAGGAEDVNTMTVAGTVYLPDSTKCIDCNLTLIPTDHIPNGTELDSSSYTDENGEYKLTVTKGGTYNLWAVKDSLSIFIYNVISDSGDIIRDDTLKHSGSIKVTLPDDFSTKNSGSIHIVGTGYFLQFTPDSVEIKNGLGSLNISNIAPNSYNNIIYNSENILRRDSIVVFPDSTSNITISENWEWLSPLHANLIGKEITAIATSNSKTIYVGTKNAGLFIKDSLGWTNPKPADPTISLTNIIDIETYKDTVYFVSDSGIIKLTNNNFENITRYNATIKELSINDITILDNGELHAAFSQGLGFYNGSTWAQYTTASSTPLTVIVTISGINDSTLYAADLFGILRYSIISDNRKWEYIYKDDLKSNKIAVNSNADVWLATQLGLLNYKKSSISTYDSIAQINISTISAGKDNTIWVYDSVENRVHGIRNNTSIYSSENSEKLSGIEITAIASLDKTTTLFGTKSSGILVLSYQ